MKINSKILKLSRLLKLVSETKLQDGTTLTHEGDLTVGTEVFVESEDGEVVPASDGEYIDENGIKIMVEGSKVIGIIAPEAPLETTEEVKEEQPSNSDAEHNNAEPTEHNEEMSAEQPAEPAEPAEQPAEPTEQMEDERDARIAELETANAELTSQLEAANARIAELEALVNEYKEKESQSVDNNVDDAFKSQNDKKVELTSLQKIRKATR